MALREDPVAARKLEHVRFGNEVVDLVVVEPSEERKNRHELAPVERRLARARDARERINRRRRFARRPVFLRGMRTDFRVQHAQLRGEVVRDRALDLERDRLAARDHRAEIVAADEPAVDVRRRNDSSGANAALDERHFAEHIAVAQLRDSQRAAARQRDPRFDRSRAKQVGAARRCVLANDLRARQERHIAGDRGQPLGGRAVESPAQRHFL
jgi:hypothetical protein